MLDENKDKFIKNSLGDYEFAGKLPGDASSREYYRIKTRKGLSYILCFDKQLSGLSLDNYAYYVVYNIFKEENIPIPSVYEWDNSGLLLIQDLGDLLLEKNLNDLSYNEKKRIYKESIDILVKIQGIEREKNIIPFSLSFDSRKLMFEFNFFIEHALMGYFQSQVSEKELKELSNEFIKISELLDKPGKFVLNHRDYISRNIILYNNKPNIIDFQDARLGLPQYDLVSLLRDSGPSLEIDLYKFLKNYYYNLAYEKKILKMSVDEFEYYFDIMAFQRNVKIIGTFAFQSFQLKKSHYEQYIIPTIKLLSDYANRRRELRAAYNIITRYVEVD